MKNYILTSLFLILAVAASGAELSLIHLDRGRNISNNYIMGFAQDRKGYIWVSTESGLNRFDGTAFRQFKRNNSDIGADALNKLYADKADDILWIATQRRGLDRLDLDTYKYTHFRHTDADPGSIASDGVTAVAPANDGGLWVATYTDGLDYLDKKTGTFSHFNSRTVDGWPGDKLWNVCADNSGNVYLAHVEKGFSVFNPHTKKIRNYRHNSSDPGSLPSDQARAVFIDSNHNIWVGTDKGLALFSPLEGSFTTFRHSPVNDRSLVSDRVLDISQTSDGRLLVATENGGLSILDTSEKALHSLDSLEFENFTSQADSPLRLSNKTVQTVFCDSFGNIWAGTYGDGIDVLSPHKGAFETYSSTSAPFDLPSSPVMSICAYADTLWVGTDGKGAVLYGPEGKIANFDNLGDNAILAIHRDPDGNVWFGTYGGRVFRLPPGASKADYIMNGGVADIRSFADIPGGGILIGHGQGITAITADGSTRHFSDPGSHDKEELVRALLFDSSGRLFVGSFGQGLSVYSPEGRLIKKFNDWSGLPSNEVTYLAEDPRHNILVATAEGLMYIRPDLEPDTANIAVRHLAKVRIASVEIDDADRIWISTDDGITLLTPDSIVRDFRSAYQSNLTDFSRGASGHTGDGRIFFGSHYGVSSFLPSVIDNSSHVPSPVFTAVTLFNSFSDTEKIEYVLDDGVNVPYDQNTIRVSFGILDPAEADAVDFRYRFAGKDSRWYPCTNRSNLILSNLPAGKYKLALQAVSRDGSGESEVSYLDITVTPPLWATWWAKLIYFLLAAALIAFLVNIYKNHMRLEYDLTLERRNSRHQQELNAERMRFFTNITHELRTPLTLILGPLEDLKSEPALPEKFRRRVTAINRSANRLLDLINTILEFRKTETQNRGLRVSHGDMSKLVKEIGLRYKELNTNNSLTIDTEVEAGDYHLWFDPEIVAMIVDNLMSNACKYTNSGKVTLRLHHTEESGVPFTEISVADTGIGMGEDTLKHIFDRYYRDRSTAETRLGTGIGLALVNNLVRLHEGEIFADSEYNRGSEFRFRLHTDNAYPSAERRDTPFLSDVSEQPSAEVGDTKAVQDSRETVLVVEDNDEIIEYIRDTLSDEYDVVAASNGENGLKIAKDKNPDIIITDIMMPGMDGISMIRNLKKDNDTEYIPVIIVTAKTADDARREAYEAGADSFITKPFSSKVLRSRIHNILQTRHNLALNILGRTAEDTTNADAGVGSKHADEALVSEMSQADTEFVAKVGSIIKDNIASDTLDVAFIADKMCMSHSTLYRKVKSITGLTIARLIRRERARFAAELLSTGKYTVSEISLMVGMGSQANFRQCFKEEFGVTPSEYRKG